MDPRASCTACIATWPGSLSNLVASASHLDESAAVIDWKGRFRHLPPHAACDVLPPRHPSSLGGLNNSIAVARLARLTIIAPSASLVSLMRSTLRLFWRAVQVAASTRNFRRSCSNIAVVEPLALTQGEIPGNERFPERMSDSENHRVQTHDVLQGSRMTLWNHHMFHSLNAMTEAGNLI